jgi:hydrogenase-4 component F
MTAVLVALTVLPLLGAVLALLPGHHAAPITSVTAGVACFGLAVALIPAAVHGPVALGFLRADAISVVFELGTAFLYATVAVYSVGYLRGERDRADFSRYSRLFWVGLNLFAWAMLCAPLMDGLALLWIAVEITTVISALLVALDGTRSSAEAAWKYVLIASAGLGIALLATIVMYYAGASVFGSSYDLAFPPLLRAGSALPHPAVQLAFVLAVVGFGTKVGLFPVHTWLPDAHSEAPTPVLVFGMLSLLLAALYLVEQGNLKRLLAYSSVEHMGILAIGVSFGAPIAFAGVLLHVLAHAAAKSNAFFGAGVLVRAYGTKEIGRIRGGLDRLPWTAPLFLCAILALSAMPPFGLFRSEFQIIAGGLASARYVPAAAMVALVTLAFLGLSIATTRMLFVPCPSGPGAATAPRGEPSAWMVAPMVVGVLALLVLGLHPPDALAALIAHGAAELGGAL